MLFVLFLFILIFIETPDITSEAEDSSDIEFGDRANQSFSSWNKEYIKDTSEIRLTQCSLIYENNI